MAVPNKYADTYFQNKALDPNVDYTELAQNDRRAAYEKAIQSRSVASDAAPAAEEASAGSNAAMAKSGTDQMAAASAQGNGAGTLGGGLMAAGAIPSPASPYLLAAGMGLSVVGAGEQNKRNQQNAQREAYNARIAKRQEMLNQIAQNNRIS